MERSGILKFLQLFFNCPQLVLDLSAFVLGNLGRLQALLLNEEILLLRQFVEELGQIGSLLGRNLCCGGVRGSGTVSESKDAIRAHNTEMSIDGQATAVYLDRGELTHQVLRQCSESVSLVSVNMIGVMNLRGRKDGTYSGPDDHPTRDLFHALVGHLEDDAFLFDFLDHRLGQDINFSFLKGRLGVVDEGFAERGQHGWESLHKGDLHPTGEFRIPIFEIFLQEIVDLATEKAKDQKRALKG